MGPPCQVMMLQKQTSYGAFWTTMLSSIKQDFQIVHVISSPTEVLVSQPYET